MNDVPPVRASASRERRALFTRRSTAWRRRSSRRPRCCAKTACVDLTDFNHRKRQGLLEINRILRKFDDADLAASDRTRVYRLVAMLDDNQRMLAHHLKAVDEIASLLSRAMQEAESDGTYGRGGAPSTRYEGRR